MGVDIFFALSGFLITLLLLQEIATHNHIHFGYFYARRVLRLTPAFLLLVCTYLLISAFFAVSWEDYQPHVESSVISFFYLANWARAFEWYPAPNYLSHSWSLAIEEQFYLFWPICLAFFVRIFRRAELGVMLGALCIIVVTWWWRYYLLDSGASFMRIYNGLDTRMDALMFGAFAAAFYCIKKPTELYLRYFSPVITALAVAVLVFMTMTAHWNSATLYVWQLPIIHLACAVAIYNLSYARGAFAQLLGQKLFVYLGRISYGIYLWHFPVLLVLIKLGQAGWPLLALTFITTILIASASYFTIELPALALKRKFRPRREVSI